MLWHIGLKSKSGATSANQRNQAFETCSKHSISIEKVMGLQRFRGCFDFKDKTFDEVAKFKCREYTDLKIGKISCNKVPFQRIVLAVKGIFAFG